MPISTRDGTSPEIFRDTNSTLSIEEYFSEGLKPTHDSSTRVGNQTGETACYQFLDSSGNIAFDKRFYAVCGFHDGLAAACPPGSKKLGYISRTGEFIIPPKYEFEFLFDPHFSCGLAPFSRKGRWGYIDKSGSEIIPAKYDWGRNFVEGLAAVRIGHRWGFIDKHGRLIVPAKFDWVNDFSDGACLAYEGGVFHKDIDPICENGGNFFRLSRPLFLDKTGTVLFKPKLRWNEKIESFHEGFAALTPASFVERADGSVTILNKDLQ